MRTLIFIGGTAHSGSTVFDMILANDPKAFSCGEVHALFNPYRGHHINPQCGCGETQCRFWQQVLKNSESALYETIFDLLPKVEFIVDSSKNPYWISSQTKSLIKTNIEVKNVLIWKSPYEFALSYKKRGRLRHWEKHWIDYHRTYFSLVQKWKGVKYCNLNNSDYLNNVCEYLELPYFKDKDKYWNKTHHTLFGSNLAKLHLYPMGSENYKNTANKLINASPAISETQIKHLHRKTNNRNTQDKLLNNIINERVSSNRYLRIITLLLDNNDIINKAKNANALVNDILISQLILKVNSIRRFIISTIRQFRFSKITKLS